MYALGEQRRFAYCSRYKKYMYMYLYFIYMSFCKKKETKNHKPNKSNLNAILII